jgi:hypothetical protein
VSHRTARRTGLNGGDATQRDAIGASWASGAAWEDRGRGSREPPCTRSPRFTECRAVECRDVGASAPRAWDFTEGSIIIVGDGQGGGFPYIESDGGGSDDGEIIILGSR